ncbi:hypothetical protein SELMODRAFT_416855 [Selaginella moellendorffii]|uniref:Uncharacterized protein n=1 Tax=Selaginella moellendorffii TaxID=88036 RepID=D8S0L8_SELML|nr:hypothetical protein SELMODRAFT_416855 [Selaginella moellendorffii]
MVRSRAGVVCSSLIPRKVMETGMEVMETDGKKTGKKKRGVVAAAGAGAASRQATDITEKRTELEQMAGRKQRAENGGQEIRTRESFFFPEGDYYSTISSSKTEPSQNVAGSSGVLGVGCQFLRCYAM